MSAINPIPYRFLEGAPSAAEPNCLRKLASKVSDFIFSKWGVILAGTLLIGACIGAVPALIFGAATSLLPLFIQSDGMDQNQTASKPIPTQSQRRHPSLPSPSQKPQEQKAASPTLPIQVPKSAPSTGAQKSTETSVLGNNQNQAVSQPQRQQAPPPVTVLKTPEMKAEQKSGGFASLNWSELSIFDQGRLLNINWFNQTARAMENGQYTLPDGSVQQLDMEAHERSGKNAKMIPFTTPLPPGKVGQKLFLSSKSIRDAAQALVEKGLHPLVLCPSHATTPGIDVYLGGFGEEETLCRQSTLYAPLYLFSPIHNEKYEIPAKGGLFVPEVQLFRGNPEDSYPFLKPFKVDLFCATPYNCEPNQAEYNKPEEAEYREGMKEKMRAAFRTAIENKNDALVLGAFGYGQRYQNDPQLIASFYKEVLGEPEFRSQFKEVVFAIPDFFCRTIFNLIFKLIPEWERKEKSEKVS